MLAALWSESVREPEEVFLVDRVQHRDGRPLDDFVLKSGNRERALLAIRLRYVDPPRWLCPIHSLMEPGVQVHDLAIKVSLVGSPCQPIHARGRVLLQFGERVCEVVDADMMKECSELLLLPLP